MSFECVRCAYAHNFNGVKIESVPIRDPSRERNIKRKKKEEMDFSTIENLVQR